MTDINVDELIADGREYAKQLRGSTHVRHTGADLVDRLADALAQLQRTLADADRQFTALKVSSGKTDAAAIDLRAERDEALAVIERARARLSTDLGADDEGHVSDTLTILDAAPADALREYDASLIEALADNLVREGVYDPDEGYLDAYEPSHVAWLREKARERREGVA